MSEDAEKGPEQAPASEPTPAPASSTRSVNQPPPRGPIKLDKGYVITLPALIKVAELVIAIVCLGCVGSSAFIHGAQGFFIFVAVIGFIITLFLYILFLLGLVDWINFPWEFIEMAYGIGAVLLYLIASITLAVYTYGFSEQIAGVVFGFINMILYAFGTFWSFQEWRSAGEAATAQ